MLRTRIITALVGIPLILAILYLGGVYWMVFFALLGIGGLYEFHRMVNKEYQPSLILGIILMLIVMFNIYNTLLLPTFVLFILCLVIYLVTRFPQISIVDLSLSIFPALYLGFSLSFVILLSQEPHAFLVMLAVFLFTWSSDIGGFTFGRLWGKNKLAPHLSPNKTWEGSIGGIILTVVTGIIFFKICNVDNLNLYNIILIGIISSIAAQLGDLFMSSVKRVFAVKDSGNLIPGHGGILDRF
ncbi:MAG: phosphatidate cytidylyltransferase, partial [Syntrophomonadaceae bacterium]|nr:phosphatidate cytidylyltransferase [Syntrophomonadaceae bacterium]